VPAPAIELKRVSKGFDGQAVVRSLDLEIESGETFVLVGPSGCGKTTTLKMINRLVAPDSGSIEVLGRDVAGRDAAELRRGIGYVIQDVGLFAHWDVRRNVGVVPSLLGWDAERIGKRVDEVLALVELPPEQFAGRMAQELSGGQKQRVGVARALAADPPIVLMDEPFGALDPITRERLQDEFIALSKRLKKTFVLVTHDMSEAVRLGDRIAVMRAGSVVQMASPRAIVEHPADDFVASLLGRHRYESLWDAVKDPPGGD
jgi:osmoprotectant transport system ATP-binding protein